MSGRELAGFFDLVERVGCVRLPASSLLQSSSMEALVALRAERVIEDGTAVEALPCPHKAGCTREVRDTWEEEKKPARHLESARPLESARRYLAVCGQDPAECDGGWLTEGEVRTMVVRLEALVRMVTRHLGVRPGVDELPRAWGAPGEPRLIGTQERAALEGATRDVFLALRPHAEISPAWLALRERGTRAAVVLVPTMRRIAPELSAAHGPLDRVEILPLGEAFAVRDGSVALSAREAGHRAIGAVKAGNDADALPRQKKETPKPLRHPQLRRTRGAELPPIQTWRDLRVCLLDEKTVRFDGCGKYARFTAHDLGLASRKTLKTTRAWSVLAMTCDHGGAYTKFEKRFVLVRKQVSLLGLRLQALFGIDEPPFHEPSSGVYRSKFIARVGLPAEADGELVADE